ncbi:uncharacterized protein LOC123320178 [Coccinella septempunctata]|uniref:uncharacterized protein LOC123320178 n=1 Tax=Coccinella septempunctata TaxID=41139 RepID=UPI001D07BAA9|nr:uncharacterized protein LOC123320178 [Coccinella septempunctata]
MIRRSFFVIFLASLQLCHGGPPKVETKVMLLDSYIPAAMQVIAHLTESMKYDLKPPSTTTPSPARPSDTTKPTSTHRPGIYAPEVPPGPDSYEKLGELENYGEELASSKTFFSIPKLQAYLNVETEELPENLENLIGVGPASLVKLVHSEDDAPASSDPEEQVRVLLKNLDDSEFIRAYLEKNKRAPPTKAYVTLLSLYDQLSKDAKSQGYNKFQGYHQHVLVELSKTSSGTAADQLKFVLEKILTNQDSKQPEVKRKISALLEDLKTDNSYIHKALLYIPPLQFSI